MVVLQSPTKECRQVIKTGTFPNGTLDGESTNGVSGVWAPVHSNLGSGSYSLTTFNHDLRKLGHGDQGGPFLLEKTEPLLVKTWMVTTKYRGEVTAWAYDTPDLLNAPSDASLQVSGTKGIALTTPTTSEWSASQFLGETLQDGVPRMVGHETWRAQTLRAKQAGSEYLNYEFGWLPFASDIQSFAHAVNNSSEIIANYRDGANKTIRRKFEFPRSTTTSSRQQMYFIKAAGSTGVGQTLTTWNKSHDQRTWFAGAYKYYLPVGDSAADRFKRYKSYAGKLLGLRLTPETVWNVAPWSWAVDWRTDVGDVVHNYSQLGTDGLVLQYGYVMSSTSTFSEAVSSRGRYGINIVRKVRIPATPFGFGVDMNALSSKQVSILVALGLSHGR